MFDTPADTSVFVSSQNIGYATPKIIIFIMKNNIFWIDES